MYWNILVQNCLILGTAHFMLCRKVDPELHHLKFPSFSTPFLLVVFFVKHTTGGSHPLHIPFSYNTTPTTAVVMLYFAFIGDGHSFKAPMWMYTNTPRSFRCWKCML